MRIIKGTRQGQRVQLARLGHDYIAVKEDPGFLPSPLLVQLESADEVERFWQDPHSETFWKLWELQPDCTFKKKHAWH